jgi:hypothetical protein
MTKKRGRLCVLACVATIAALAAFGSLATAAEQCRDAGGRFIRCPVAPATVRCRDVTSKKFVKCGAPHSETVPAPASK